FQVCERAGFRIVEAHRVRRVTTKLCIGSCSNNDRPGTINRDFFGLGIDSADRSGYSTLAPLAAITLSLVSDVAFAHHVKLERGHGLSIFRHAATRKDAVTQREIGSRNYYE